MGTAWPKEDSGPAAFRPKITPAQAQPALTAETALIWVSLLCNIYHFTFFQRNK